MPDLFHIIHVLDPKTLTVRRELPPVDIVVPEAQPGYKAGNPLLDVIHEDQRTQRFEEEGFYIPDQRGQLQPAKEFLYHRLIEVLKKKIERYTIITRPPTA